MVNSNLVVDSDKWQGIGFGKRHISSDSLDYEKAVQKLNSLQTNAMTIALAQNQGPLSHVEQSAKVESTTKYLSRIGIGLDQVDRLSVMHIAGTKGKGTTAALCEAILRQHGYRTGFYSSPHLVQARERIRLNGRPLSQRQFTDYLNHVYQALEQKKEHNGDMPAYFKFLTVMAFHVFLKEEVDVAIVEVGIGGEYDCTNFIRKPAVVGITALGLDHTNILGTTMADIAWQKAGVMKPGSLAFTVPQPSPDAMDVLRQRAINRQCSLKVAPPLDSYSWNASSSLTLSHMVEDVYATNASLAIQLSNAWLGLQSPFSEKEEMQGVENETVPIAKPFLVTRKMEEGLVNCAWPGRTQILTRGRVTYFLDGAHTEDSIAYCIKWFKSSSSVLQTEPVAPRRMLIFNTTGARASDKFLNQLSQCQFDTAVFAAMVPFSNQTNSSDQFSKDYDDNTALNGLVSIWNEIHPSSTTQVFRTLSDALQSIESQGESTHVLVTGSVHLVGAALCVLDPDLKAPVQRVTSSLVPLQNVYSGIQAVL